MLETDALKKYRRYSQKAADAYMLGMAVLFPIFCTDRYFNILGDRANFFLYWTLAASVVILGLFLLFAVLLHCRESHNAYRKAFPKIKECVRLTAGYFSMPDILAILLFFSLCITTALSPWRYESLTGSAGRLQGLLMWTAYIAAWFIVSWHFNDGNEDRRRTGATEGLLIELFLGLGALLALWGIADYAGLDLFGWIAKIKKGQRGMFTSSFGNINTYTQVMSVYAAACAGSLANGKGNKTLSAGDIFRLCEFSLFLTALITGQSDNAVFGIAAIFALLPFVLWDTKKGFLLYYMAFSTLVLGFFQSGLLTDLSVSEFSGYDKGILLSICKNRLWPAALFAAATIAFIFTQAAFSYRHDFCWKALKKAWSALIVAGIAAAAAAFIDVNFRSGSLKYGAAAKILLFNDSWGTYRGFAWKTAIRHFADFSFLMKIFGSGLETFGILTKQHDYSTMMAVCGQVFDSPHNEVLQFLVTSGVSGTFLFYGWAATCMWEGAKMGRTAAWLAASAYIAVSLVSISVPIAMPYCILALALCARKSRG